MSISRVCLAPVGTVSIHRDPAVPPPIQASLGGTPFVFPASQTPPGWHPPFSPDGTHAQPSLLICSLDGVWALTVAEWAILSPFLQAKEAGTSVDMLEKFYGQTVTSALAAQITKGNQSGAGKKEKAYPFG